MLVRKCRVVRHLALLTGKIPALGKIPCTMAPRIFPIARKFPIKAD